MLWESLRRATCKDLWSSPQRTASQKTGPPSHSYSEPNVAHNPVSFEEGPEIQKKMQPTDTLIPSL